MLGIAIWDGETMDILEEEGKTDIVVNWVERKFSV